MSSRSVAAGSIVGALLLVLGLSLIGSALWLNYTPLEEPANPGKTPNPSQMDREILLLRLGLYAAPVAGLLLGAIGIWLLTAAPRRRDDSGI